jgi:hypothetical protein
MDEYTIVPLHAPKRKPHEGERKRPTLLVVRGVSEILVYRITHTTQPALLVRTFAFNQEPEAERFAREWLGLEEKKARLADIVDVGGRRRSVKTKV